MAVPSAMMFGCVCLIQNDCFLCYGVWLCLSYPGWLLPVLWCLAVFVLSWMAVNSAMVFVLSWMAVTSAMCLAVFVLSRMTVSCAMVFGCVCLILDGCYQCYGVWLCLSYPGWLLPVLWCLVVFVLSWMAVPSAMMFALSWMAVPSAMVFGCVCLILDGCYLFYGVWLCLSYPGWLLPVLWCLVVFVLSWMAVTSAMVFGCVCLILDGCSRCYDVCLILDGCSQCYGVWLSLSYPGWLLPVLWCLVVFVLSWMAVPSAMMFGCVCLILDGC